MTRHMPSCIIVWAANRATHFETIGEYFWSPEGQEEYNHTNKEWKAHVRKHREETSVDIDEPISNVKSPYQMDSNSLVARAHRPHLCAQTQLQEEERMMGR